MNFCDEEIHDNLKHALVTLHDLCNSIDSEIQLNAAKALAELMLEIDARMNSEIDIEKLFEDTDGDE